MNDLQNFWLNIGPFLWLLLVAVVVGGGFWLYSTQQRTEKTRRQLELLIRDTRAGSLDALLARLERVERSLDVLDTIQVSQQALDGRMLSSLQGIGVVRFNPFAEMGGDQSFALAVVDANADGFVMSSLHGRNATRLYAKVLQRGQSSTALSAEEQQALDQAMLNQQTISRAR